MEATDSVRPDVSKDFFDFPGDHADKKKEMGVYLEGEQGGSESKEANNNHLMMNSVDIVNYVDSGFWCGAEGNLLEELGCWPPGQAKGDNTDGTIYTLTVLNGGGPPGPTDQPPPPPAAWFKQEDKEERLPQSTLDIDSLLNIIPAGFPPPYQEKPDLPFREEAMSYHEQPYNNNEWKENNNEVDSLLRNALQGKGFRYNGIKVEKEDKKEEKMVMETPMMYDGLHDSDNPSSGHSMDEIFLSQLDVSYPEDYEKLKRIETEVAESVEQYCLDRSYQPPIAIDPVLLQGKTTKKYSKRNKSGAGSSGSGVRKERSLHYCNICSKGFKDKYSVNVHIRTHTGEKPFTCSLCGKSFRQKAHLAKHYQTHMAQAKSGLGGGAPSHKSKSLIPTS